MQECAQPCAWPIFDFQAIQHKVAFSSWDHKIIILENSISVHKPILDSGKCSLSRISTLTSIVTKQKFIYIMSRNGAQGPYWAFYTLNR